MTDLDGAVERLRAWIRDFGHLKQPVFINDLTMVLDVLKEQGKTAVGSITQVNPWTDQDLYPDLAKCDVPPPGWRCTREKVHDGPCAAVPE